MNWLTNFIPPKIRFFSKKRDIPDNLWETCPRCVKMLYRKELQANLFVCHYCQHHLKWPVFSRLEHLFDEGIYTTYPIPKVRIDPLKFHDQKYYKDRLKDARRITSQEDAVVVTQGKVQGIQIVVACFNFEFIGGSMGMAAGEAIILGAQKALEKRIPYLIISASGGARMQEGVFSLIQMPRTILATVMMKEAKIPLLCLMTNPTTGGVAASFSALGDILLAEPESIIGFTGPRVLKSTRQVLPEGFQTAQFQKDHGFLDLIIHRKDIPSFIKRMLTMLQNGKKW